MTASAVYVIAQQLSMLGTADANMHLPVISPHVHKARMVRYHGVQVRQRLSPLARYIVVNDSGVYRLEEIIYRQWCMCMADVVGSVTI